MNIFLTLDYELFMGRLTGTPMKCLIEPMKLLTDVAERHNAKFVIFADAAYLLRLRQLSPNNPAALSDFNAVVSNLCELSKQGHDIQLHFHPQWLYSQYGKDGWSMDLTHYKLSDMSDEDIQKYFSEAKALLDDILKYSTIAFRAGGYSLNSYPKYISLLRENSIFIDSSVCSNTLVKTPFQAYDYRRVPNKSVYRFSEDIKFEDLRGRFIELPITRSKKYPSFIYLMKKKQLHKSFGSNMVIGDGIGVGAYTPKDERFKALFFKIMKGKAFNASMDGFMVENLQSLYLQQSALNAQNMVVIGHPKNASRKSAERLNGFLSSLAPSDRIITFREYYEEKN